MVVGWLAVGGWHTHLHRYHREYPAFASVLAIGCSSYTDNHRVWMGAAGCFENRSCTAVVVGSPVVGRTLRYYLRGG